LKQIHVAVIGACGSGGIRAETAHRNPLFKNRYIAETTISI
jgi:hypothetical protein